MDQGNSAAIDDLMSALEGLETAIGPACEANYDVALSLLNFALRKKGFEVVSRVRDGDAPAPAPTIEGHRVPALPLLHIKEPEPVVKPTGRKTLSQPLFEYEVLAILRGRKGCSTGKTELLAALPSKLKFGSPAAITTRLNKMSRAMETNYVDWEKGKQRTPITTTPEGEKRLLQLEGTGSGSLSPEDKKFLKRHGGWFGPSLDRSDG